MDRPALPQEDLFESSTMTFGEHLDELRRSLVKAITWLIIGALVAIAFIAKPVVRMIQGPLEQAIIEYQANRSMEKFRQALPAEVGAALDGEAGNQQLQFVDRMKEFMLTRGLAWQQIYLPAEVLNPDSPLVTLPVPAEEEAEGKPEEKESPALAEGNSPQVTSVIPQPDDFRRLWVLAPTEAGLNTHQVEEPFMIYIKASVVVGAVLGSPMIFYHLWSFVAAGLYPHERKYVYTYLPFSVGLFVFGVLLAFFAVLKYVLSFLLDFNSTLSVDLEPRLSYYMSFVLLLPLGFGIAFQLPLVMLFLQRIGIFQTSAYENSWRIAVLVIAVLSMLLTPADPYSMILLMCPLIVLYFLGIGLCRYMPRGRGLGSAAYDPR